MHTSPSFARGTTQPCSCHLIEYYDELWLDIARKARLPICGSSVNDIVFSVRLATDCYSVLWQYRSLRALSSSMSILFCFSSTATRFSRHLTYSFFFRRHSRAASLEATTERLCEHESCKSYILFTGPTSCKSEMQNIIMASMETQIKSKPGKLELWVLVYVHVQRKWFHKPSFSILSIAMKQRKLLAHAPHTET